MCTTTPAPAPARALAPLTPGSDALALGFDFGTSGARCALVDATGAPVCDEPSYAWGERERCQEASDWEAALEALLDDVPVALRRRVRRICISGTSGSVLLVDDSGEAAAGRGDPRMHDFSVAKQKWPAAIRTKPRGPLSPR